MSRYDAAANGAHHFTISEADFARDSLLKRRHMASPSKSPRRAAATSTTKAATASSNTDGTIAFRARSKSKSRARPMRRVPSIVSSNQQFIPLGRSGGAASRPVALTRKLSSSFIAGAARPLVRQTSAMSAVSDDVRGRKREREPVPVRAPVGAARSSTGTVATRTRSRSKDRRSKSKSKSRPKAQPRAASKERRGRSTSARRDSHRSSHSSSSRSRRRSPSQSRRRRSRSRSRSHSRRSRSRSPSESDSKSDSDSSSESDSGSDSESRSQSRSKSRRRGGSRERKRAKPSSASSRRSKSKSRARAPAASSVDQQLQRDLKATRKQVETAKQELATLEEELVEVQARVDAKKYAMQDLQIVLDGLERRRELQQRYQDARGKSLHRWNGALEAGPEPSSSPSPSPSPAPRSTVGSKRPRIVDEEDEDDNDDDDDVQIIAAPTVKKEPRRRERGDSRRVSPDRAPAGRSRDKAVKPTPSPSSKPPAPRRELNDHFWGRVEIAKLLVQPRPRNIPDGHGRKVRHLAFNPIQQDVFATSSDDGGLILWNYTRQGHDVTPVVSFAPESFRKEAPCAESMAWSPDGDRLALAFRDPVESLSEFCVVRLHQLTLTDNRAQMLPRERLKSKATTLHSKGISAIDWVPSGYGDSTGSRGLITTGSDHNVVLWEEHDALKSHADFKWRVLHHEHRSDVRSICMHSQRDAVYTGGLDGLVIRFDMNAFRAHTIVERRRPHISKINAVLENPHNPHLLLVSSVEPGEHNLLLHDLRQRYSEHRENTMTLTLLRSADSKAMSQYIVPRWSPGGFHVSCGSPSGMVNIWDVRVRGPQFPVVSPQQSINVHQKQVLHATWHPRYDAMFSVSHDRSIGLLTFR